MIILTGGAGFIGSVILSRLNARGIEDIMVVDHLEDADVKKENLKGKSFRDFLDKSDFLERVKADRVPDGVEAVIHMGACSSTTLNDARYYEENNYLYTRHLAEWAFQRDVRLIYASSGATYGDGSRGYSDDDTVTRTLQPLNLYGESKHRFDLWLLDHGFGRRAAGLKFFNVFGPNEYHKGEMRSVIAKSYQVVAEKGTIGLFKSYRPEYGHGEQKRDFIYVKDAVDVVLFFLDNPQVSGIFNVGTGQARSWNDLAAALFQAMDKAVNIEYIEMPESLRPRYQYFTQAGMDKLRAAGYHKPFISLEDAIKDYVVYLKDHLYF